jgi:hypothetical protein
MLIFDLGLGSAGSAVTATANLGTVLNQYGVRAGNIRGRLSAPRGPVEGVEGGMFPFTPISFL